MASRPGYDANHLDAEFERLVSDERAPLVNRVTQGQYQPGLLLQPFLLAIGQRNGQLDLSGLATEDTSGEVIVDGISLACKQPLAEPLTWATAMIAQCPGPMIELAEIMGESDLLSAIDEFGFLSQPDLPIITEVGPSEMGDAQLAAIGQDSAAVSPLQVGLALAALANGGQFKQAQMVSPTQDATGSWIAEPIENAGRQVVPANVSKEILGLFSEDDGIREHDLVVLSGPEDETNSWYLGLAPAANPRYGVVVVIEDEDSSSSARNVGRALLKEVLDPDG